jgi:glutathione S-transferase
MKLLYAAPSPFARKVLACAVARDIDQQIERVPTQASVLPPALLAANPLGKVPTLITEDGTAFYDSRVICEYLDSIGDAPAMFPPSGAARWRALRFQALGDGVMDAAVLRRDESQRPREAARDGFMAYQAAKVARGLQALERDVPHETLDVGSIAVACALLYLDFRFAAEPWRPAQPKLAQWLDTMARQPPFARTEPA